MLKQPSFRAGQCVSIPQKISSYSFQIIVPLQSCILISITIDQFLPIPGLYTKGNIHYVLIYVWLLSLNIIVLRFIHVVVSVISLFILLLGDIQMVPVFLPAMNTASVNILYKSCFVDISTHSFGRYTWQWSCCIMEQAYIELH